MFDEVAFGEAMGDMIRQMIEPLVKRIVELEARDIGDQVRMAVAALPAPKNGEPGKDAPAVDLEVLVKRVAELVPKPADGKPGADAPAVDLAAVAKLVVVPIPADGKDGHGLAGAMIDRDGSLQITLSNGEVKNLGRVVGKDGADGISFDAFDLEYLPESHEVLVRATVGTRTKELRYPAGGIRPAGYWRDGTKAKACEAWVHDGSLWIATRETGAKPASNSPDWHIAARKGRDGETTVRTIGPTEPIKLKA